MTHSRIAAVIPARMASSRFPGKPLVPLFGVPMVEYVRRRALLSAAVHEVVVATCDEAIADAVAQAGGRVVMTADTHERCTERVEEAARALTADVVLVVQGDEPLLQPEALDRVAAPLLEDPEVVCTNLLTPLESREDLANPDVVKAACAATGDVLFLTRAAIPHYRVEQEVPVYRQTGIMGFRASFLHRYVELAETPLERAESVDCLRILEHGFRIRGVVGAYPSFGVDRPHHVSVIERVVEEDAVQRALHAATVARL